MLLIIIGIVVLAIGGLIAWRITSDALGGFASFICIILCLIGVFVPLHGYNELDVQKYELNSLYEGIYVIKDEKGAFICNYAKGNQKEETHSRYNTGAEEVIFIENGKKPVLIKYNKEAKRSIWTMALGADMKNNIFYVPESGYRDMREEHVD